MMILDSGLLFLGHPVHTYKLCLLLPTNSTGTATAVLMMH